MIIVNNSELIISSYKFRYRYILVSNVLSKQRDDSFLQSLSWWIYPHRTLLNNVLATLIIDLRFPFIEEIAIMFYNQVDRYIICMCFTLLFVIGFIGYGTFLLVVALIDQMRTRTNFYLANSVIADIIFIVAVVYENFITFLLSPEVKTLAYYTPVGCGAMFTAIYGSHFRSVALMILVALDRYLAICKPLKHRLIVAKGHPGGKSPVGAFRRVEALQFFHVFKTILIVSLRRDEMLTWLIFHPFGNLSDNNWRHFY